VLRDVTAEHSEVARLKEAVQAAERAAILARQQADTVAMGSDVVRAVFERAGAAIAMLEARREQLHEHEQKALQKEAQARDLRRQIDELRSQLARYAEALEEDLALFWGKRREVSVVQRRLVEKDGRVDVTAAFSTIPNDDFIAYFPLGLRAGYHFSESFAVEASFAYALQKPSDLTTFLKEDPQISLKEAEIQEKIDMFYNVAVLWAPIYGKVSVLGNKLTHFETYVGLGAGVFHTTTKDANNPDPQPEVKPAGNTVLGFRWFINDNFNLRTDYRHYFFQKFGGGVSIPAEFSLGLGFLI
jgi:outer membrane beta-barrel protein